MGLGIAAMLLPAAGSASAAVIPLGSAPAQTYVTNGPVSALARSGSTLYIGGNFSKVGPRTGPEVALNPSSGALAHPAPQLAGTGVEIDAVVPDGSGGNYIGGNFHYLVATPSAPGTGPTAHGFLVHILANGNLDTTFAPTLNSRVLALVRSGGTLYAGGDFTKVDGQTEHFLVALNATTGALNTSFHPSPDNAVVALALDGSTLVAGGAFSSIGGDPDDHFVGAVNTSSGAAVTGFNAHADGAVQALAISGDAAHVYVGGSFQSIGGQSYANLAELTLSSGAAVAAFNPAPDAPVYSLLLTHQHLYAAGTFFSIGGQSKPDLALIDGGTGAADTTFSPDPFGGVFALTASPDGSTVYAGGEFTSLGGASDTAFVGAVDAATGAPVATFKADVNNTVFALADDGTNVYAGGAFTSANAQPFSDLAALDLNTGAVIPAFTPGVPAVSALAISPNGKILYAAGSGGEPAEALSTTNGDPVSSFAPSTGLGSANALAISTDGKLLYAAGGFPGLGSGYAIALNTSDGSVASGWPTTAGGGASNGVALDDAGLSLALDGPGGKLYVGGDFTGSVIRLSAATGALDGSFSPRPGSPPPAFTGETPEPPDIHAVALSADRGTLYIGGLFGGLGCPPAPAACTDPFAQNLAAVSTASGAPVSFSPLPTGQVDAVAASPDGSTVYAGGPFASINESPPSYLAEFDPSGALSTTFAPGIDDAVFALLPSTDSKQLIIGGNFRGSLGAPQQGVAVFNPGPPLPPETAPPPPPPTVPVVSLSATGKPTLVKSGHHDLLQTGETAACKATTACSATVLLTAKVTTITHTKGKGRKKGKTKKTTKTVRVLQQTISIAAGQSEPIAFTLSSHQVKLLSAKSTSHITEALTATVTGGATVTFSSKVTSKLPKPKPKPKPKHKKHKKHKKKHHTSSSHLQTTH